MRRRRRYFARIGEEEEDNIDDERGFVGDMRTMAGASSAIEDGTDEGEVQRGSGII